MVKSKKQASGRQAMRKSKRQAGKCPGRAVYKHVMGKSEGQTHDEEEQESGK